MVIPTPTNWMAKLQSPFEAPRLILETELTARTASACATPEWAFVKVWHPSIALRRWQVKWIPVEIGSEFYIRSTTEFDDVSKAIPWLNEIWAPIFKKLKGHEG
jgi:hypothetical protein